MEPVIRKKMIVCTPFGRYENGDQKGVMDAARLRRLAANFKKYPRQVPIYSLGDHVADLDERIPDGWVEGLSVNETGELVADVKLMGQSATWVLSDLIRGASIGTVQGKNPDGSSQGEVLQHLLLTNNPFDKSLNIAAARVQGGEPVVCFFTALPVKEATKMADTTNDTGLPASGELNDTALSAIKERDDEIVSLKAENLRLKEQIANALVDKDKEALAVENVNLKRRSFAQDIRSIVTHGLRAGTLKAAWCDGFAGKGPVDYDGTLTWLKASRFYDRTAPNPEDFAFRVLKMQAETGEPIYKVGQTFRTAAPAGEEATLSLEDRERLKRAGIDPEKVLAAMKAKEGGREAYAAALQNK